MNTQVIYRAEVQVTPKIFDGKDAYYWALHQINEDGKFVIKDGYEKSVEKAFKAVKHASQGLYGA